jgi:uncharacterized membrane protein YeaQ/YmgE (transglycosylase-associated protein family)
MANIVNAFLSVLMDFRTIATAGGVGGLAALIVGFVGAPIFQFIYGKDMTMMAPLPLLKQLADPNNLISTFTVGALIGIVSSAVSRAILA